jgi:hypothetical protein
VTAAAERVPKEQADAVLDEIECCLDRIDSLSLGALSALRTTTAAMLAEDRAGRYSEALSRLLEALAASAEAAAGAQGGASGGAVVAPATAARARIAAANATQGAASGAASARSPRPDRIRAAAARRVVAAPRPGVLRGS